MVRGCQDVDDSDMICANVGNQLEVADKFHCLGSLLASGTSCDKEVSTGIGKESAVFTRMRNIWKCKRINTHMKTRLVLATLLDNCETWNLNKANLKQLEAVHHKWQRKIWYKSGRTRS